jgi:phosphotransferase system  glucose/maltose/N-acetylglucosamine-specific IIC component
MKNLTSRVVSIIVFITLCDVVLMKLFHSIYILRDISTITNRLVFFISIVTTLTAIAAVIVIIILHPLQKTLNKLQN